MERKWVVSWAQVMCLGIMVGFFYFGGLPKMSTLSMDGNSFLLMILMKAINQTLKTEIKNFRNIINQIDNLENK